MTDDDVIITYRKRLNDLELRFIPYLAAEMARNLGDIEDEFEIGFDKTTNELVVFAMQYFTDAQIARLDALFEKDTLGPQVVLVTTDGGVVADQAFVRFHDDDDRTFVITVMLAGNLREDLPLNVVINDVVIGEQDIILADNPSDDPFEIVNLVLCAKTDGACRVRVFRNDPDNDDYWSSNTIQLYVLNELARVRLVGGQNAPVDD